MKLISATLMTAAGAAAAMLWMNRDRYMHREAQGDGSRRTGTDGNGPDFAVPATAPSVPPPTATH